MLGLPFFGAACMHIGKRWHKQTLLQRIVSCPATSYVPLEPACLPFTGQACVFGQVNVNIERRALSNTHTMVGATSEGAFGGVAKSIAPVRPENITQTNQPLAFPFASQAMMLFPSSVRMETFGPSDMCQIQALLTELGVDPTDIVNIELEERRLNDVEGVHVFGMENHDGRIVPCLHGYYVSPCDKRETYQKLAAEIKAERASARKCAFYGVLASFVNVGFMLM
jgi:hypothetical protein